MKKLALILILLAAMTSCRKDFNVTPSDLPKPTKELVVNPNFDWKTSKEITLNVVGMKDINTSIANTLYVKSSAGDTVYFKDFINMSENYVIKFAVPTTETKVILVYGSKTQTIELTSNTITFNYVTE